MAKYKTVFADEDTYEKIVWLANQNDRSIVAQLRVMVREFMDGKEYHITRITALPHPEDAQPVQLVEVKASEK